jgi:hypothetical protein
MWLDYISIADSNRPCKVSDIFSKDGHFCLNTIFPFFISTRDGVCICAGWFYTSMGWLGEIRIRERTDDRRRRRRHDDDYGPVESNILRGEKKTDRQRQTLSIWVLS